MIKYSLDSSVGIASRLRARRLRFDSWQGQDTCFFSVTTRLVLWPTQSPLRQVTGTLSPAVKRQSRGTDHSPPLSAVITPRLSSWRGA
jgi:hypothetical protein